MKKVYILLLLLCAAITMSNCSKDDTPKKEEITTADGYTYIKTAIAHRSGSYVTERIKIYKKSGIYYASWIDSYYKCFKNSSYSSSYTGSDVTKKYQYYITVTNGRKYYFNI